MKKKYVAFMIGLCLCASAVVAAPVRTYATGVDMADDELEEGEQTTVAEPGAEDEEETGDTNSSANNGNTSGSNNTSQAGSSTAVAKSSDSSLSRLGISPGTLTPAFSSGTFNYTASVDESVTRVSIPATPNHSKAVIASVTGAKNLAPGSNTVRIVVEAENGSTSTYTITVNRGAATTATQTDATQDESQENTTSSETGDTPAQTEGVIETTDETQSEDLDAVDAKVTFDENGYLVYDGETYVTTDQLPEGDYVSLDKYNALYNQQQSEKGMYSKILIALAVVLVLLIFVLINLLFKIKDLKTDAMMEHMDEEEEKRPVAKNVEAEKKAIEKAGKKAEKKALKAEEKEMTSYVVSEPKTKSKSKARTSHASIAQAKDDLEILDLNDM